MGAIVEISFLTESDRARWEVLARGKDTYFQAERSGDDKVGEFHKGLIHYAYRRDANQISTKR